MPMRHLTIGLILCGCLGGACIARAGDDWHLIELDMRNAGCFKPPIATVREALSSEDVLCRLRAARVLGLRGDPAVIPELRALFANDPDPLVRNQAAFELARLGEREYLKAAHQVVDEAPSLAQKASLAGQLADLGDTSGYPYVAESCRAEDSRTRMACIAAFWYFRKPAIESSELRAKVLSQHLELLDDPVAEVRQAALNSLATYGQEMDLPAAVTARLETLAAQSADRRTREIVAAVVEGQKRKQHHSQEKRQ
jgi:HEAT repeat protein